METEMRDQSCFFYEELSCLNVVLNLSGLFLPVVFVLLQSDQTSQVSSKFGGKKAQKRNFRPQTKTSSMASFRYRPSLLHHRSLNHIIITLCCDWLKCSQENV